MISRDSRIKARRIWRRVGAVLLIHLLLYVSAFLMIVNRGGVLYPRSDGEIGSSYFYWCSHDANLNRTGLLVFRPILSLYNRCEFVTSFKKPEDVWKWWEDGGCILMDDVSQL